MDMDDFTLIANLGYLAEIDEQRADDISSDEHGSRIKMDAAIKRAALLREAARRLTAKG